MRDPTKLCQCPEPQKVGTPNTGMYCGKCGWDLPPPGIPLTSNERNLPNLLREAERRVNAFVFKQAFPDFARIPADRDHDLDLLLCEAANEIERLTRERDDARAALGCMTRAAIDVERRSDETAAKVWPDGTTKLLGCDCFMCEYHRSAERIERERRTAQNGEE